MNKILSNFSQTDLIFILIGVVILLLLIVFIIDYLTSKKKNNILEGDIVIEGTKPIEEFLDDKNIKPYAEDSEVNKEIINNVIEENKSINNNQPQIEDIKIEEKSINEEESSKEEATKELEKVTQELIQKELEKEKNIEGNKDEEIEDNNINLTNFEKEQEENAIISYNELVKVSEELYDKNEDTQYSDEDNEPITIDQLREKFNKNSIDKEKLEDTIEMSLNNIKEEEKIQEQAENIEFKFKSSPVISPVFGIENKNKKIKENTSIELEQTADLEKLDEELKKTNEFLIALKELQKKLN